ncbi:LamG-like jellyroll fold domain-containing protein [Streptosporangium sp. NPDC002544]|uniref:LamG-like jellyroll fold domain-containing protein n=1 Tax=Streptosporangium sp. NPDC002544 TaxID=3154538 RepID=UPI00331E92F8
MIIFGRALSFPARPFNLPFTMEEPVGFPLPNRPFAPPPRRGPNRRVTTTVVTVSALAASLLVSGGALPAQADPTPTPAPSAPVQTPFPRPEDPDAPLRAAVAEARKQNKPVEATGAFTETARTWAFPDGSLKTESYSGPTQVKQDDGTWAWIDTTLVEKDGVLKPKVGKADLAFSLGGGDVPFAVMKRDAKQSLSLSWDGELPRPVVKGNVATYPDAAGPGADLVVTALPTGFRHDVVLRERPKGPLEIRIPVESPELTLTKSKQGGLQLTDGKDKVIAQAPRPVMWDSAGDGAGSRSAPIATSVVDDGGKRTLVLKPDAGWLADPATTFPVVVDPTSTLTVKTDTLLSSGADCNTNDQPGATLLKVGAAYHGCNGVDAVNYWRSYLRFDVAGLANKPIISSTMQLWRTESPACHLRGDGKVYAGQVNANWTTGRMTWSNKPGTVDFVATPCPTTNVLTPGVMTWPITNWVKAWAGGQPNYGVELKGPSESVDRYSGYSAVFHSAEMTGTGATPPKLITQYILPPEIPTVTAESVDSMDGEHAIVRESSAKVGYKSTSVDGRNIDYYVSVVDSTAPLPTWTTGGGEVGKWSFTEGTGGTDSSGKGNTLVFIANRYSWINGKDGKALFLNGTAGNPSTASTEAPVLRTDKSFSAAGWVRLDVGTNTIPLISQSGTVNSAFTVGYTTTGGKWNMQMYHDNTAGSAVTEIKSSAAAQIGTWTHLAGVYDAAAKKIRLYVNGVQAAEADYTATPWQADQIFELGNGKHAGIGYSSVKAAYDEIRAYDRALSPTEIQWMLNLTPPTNANLPSGQAASITYDVSNVDSFKISVRACINGATPLTCSESPYYRITTDAPYLPIQPQTLLTDPLHPILSAVVSRPSGGPVTGKFYLYDVAGNPVGASPLGYGTVDGGKRISMRVPDDTVRSGATYKWQIQACVEDFCTAKTEPEFFTVPGEVQLPDIGSVLKINLRQDNFVIRSGKSGADACDGLPCSLAVSTTVEAGGTNAQKTLSVLKVSLADVPEGAIPVKATLRLGGPSCGAETCPAGTTVEISPISGDVTSETKASDVRSMLNSEADYSLPAGSPSAEIGENILSWMVVESDSAIPLSYGGGGQMELELSYLPPTAPSEVRDLMVRPGDKSALLAWGFPSNPGSTALIETYDVNVLDVNGQLIKQLSVGDVQAAISGLLTGARYTFQVRPKSRFGVGPWRSVEATIPQPPPCDPQVFTNAIRGFEESKNSLLQNDAQSVAEVTNNKTYGGLVKAILYTNESNLTWWADKAAERGIEQQSSQVSLADVLTFPVDDTSVEVQATVSQDYVYAGGVDTAVQETSEDHAKSVLRYVFSVDGCGNVQLKNSTSWGNVISVTPDVNAYPSGQPGEMPTEGMELPVDDDGFPIYEAGSLQRSSSSHGSVDRIRAAAWAVDHFNDPMVFKDNDCANFISQALHHGGRARMYADGMIFHPSKRDDNSEWWQTWPYRYMSTYSWSGADNFFKHFMVTKGRAEWVTSWNNVRVGDVLLWDWSGGSLDIGHVAIVSNIRSGTWKGVEYAQHSGPYQYRPFAVSFPLAKKQYPNAKVFAIRVLK